MAEYKAIRGHTIRTVAGDPDPLLAGDIWYSSTTRKVRGAKLPAGAWATGGNLTTGRHDPGGGGTQTAGIMFGGQTTPPSTYHALTETYDGSSWTEVGDLNEAASGRGGVGQIQTAMLAIGGHPGNKDLNESWNGTAWTEIADITTGRKTVGGAGTQTAGLIFGGSNDSGNIAICEKWDGSSWTEVGDLNTARRGEGGCGATNTAALCAGGETAPGPGTVNAETWNGTSWTEVNNLNTARNGTAVSGTSSLAVAFGGGPPFVAITEYWDGSSWTEVADLSTARGRLAASSETSTTALAMGGAPNSNATEEWNFTSTATPPGAQNIKIITD